MRGRKDETRRRATDKRDNANMGWTDKNGQAGAKKIMNGTLCQ